MAPEQGKRKRLDSRKLAGRLVAVLILLSAAGGLVYVARLPRTAQEAPPTGVPPVNVRVQAVRTIAQMPDVVELPAVVEANRVVRVAAEVPGRVERICAEEGSTCSVGAALAVLNTDLLQAELDRDQARAELAAARLKRVSNLHAEGAATDEALDQARADLGVAKAVVARSRAMFERATISAPIAGVVNDITVEEGEYVQPGTPVAEIVDVDTLKVVVHVPEKDVQFFRTRSAAEVLAEVKGEVHTISGTITYISELADDLTRSTRLEITADNSDRLLRSGRIVRARLTRRVLKDVVMIPLSAVVPLEAGKVVYVVNDEKAQRREVELGLIRGHTVQVRNGLEAGELLIVEGHRFVAPGQPVNIVTQP